MANLTKIAAVFLVAVALLLVFYAWNLSHRQPPAPVPVEPKAKLVPVVVAARALPAGKPITADALRVESLPFRTARMAGTFADPAQLAQRVPIADIDVNAPVFESQLSSGLADRIAPGERAVAVKIEESNAVGNRLRAGNVVDVFFTLKREAGGLGPSEVERTQARLLLSKIRVLAFGPEVPGFANSANANAADQEPGLSARTVVLAVPMGQVDRLTLAESAGRLVLALRNPQDTDVAGKGGAAARSLSVAAAESDRARAVASASARAAQGVSLGELSESRVSRSVPSPSVAPPPKRGGSIEVIRGGRVETVAY